MSTTGGGRTWYLVRHGETEWNALSRMQGQLDSRLTPLGREHAIASARFLATCDIDRIFASPLGRVRETVAIVREHVPLDVVFDDRLKEWHSGDWSGELWADLGVKWPDEFAAWETDRYNVRSPGGENFADLVERGRAFIEAAREVSQPGSRIAIVAHGFLNRALAGVLLGLAPGDMVRLRQSNDVIMRIVEGVPPVAQHFIAGEGPIEGLPYKTSAVAQTS